MSDLLITHLFFLSCSLFQYAIARMLTIVEYYFMFNSTYLENNLPL